MNTVLQSDETQSTNQTSEAPTKDSEGAKTAATKNLQIFPFPTAAQLNPYSAAVRKSTKLAG